MKVLFNDETKVLYESLFKEAMAILNEDKAEDDESYVVIKDLSTYYQVLDQLKNLGLAKFARVPLTEEFFYINADSREITVPSAFDTNGIAVQFDHTAETLYFTIDRYFDDFDLTVCNPANNKQEGTYYGRCMIQWKNAAGDIGYDKAYMFDEGSDDVTDDNYNMITFGWPLHKKITSVSGKLEFSVIFEVVENVNEPNSKVLYSFNTLPATCMIQPNLVPDENYYKNGDPEDISDLMASSIRPSFSGVFNSALVQKAYFLPNGDLPLTANLVNGSYTFEVKAVGSGKLTYEWYVNGVSQGVNSPTYTATKAGKYYARVGNQEGDRVRWTESQVCNIPGASELYYSVDLGPKGYANGTEVTIQVDGLDENKEPLESITGTVSFQWYKRDAKGVVTSIDGATSASYTLNETDGPGHYYVIAKAFNNNDYSEDAKSSEMEVKLVAHSPSSVLLEWNEDSKKLIATPVIDYPTDLVYEWVNTDSYTVTRTRDINEYSPTVAGNYQCNVYQNPWYGEGVPWETDSKPATPSNPVTVTL